MCASSPGFDRWFFRWASACAFLGAVVLSTASARKSQPVQGPVSHAEIRFTLPGSGWSSLDETIGEAFRVTCTRLLAPERSTHFSVWPVDPAVQCRFWPAEKHVNAYFRMERQQKRPADMRWENISQSERSIAGKKYPVLRFEFVSEADQWRWPGIMLMLIPEDFARRQRFYVLMWMDSRPSANPEAWPEELDAVVQGFTIGPHRAPGILVGLTPEAAPVEAAAAKVNDRALVKKVVQAAGQPTSYRSELLLLDQLTPELQTHGQVSLHWVLDYQAPDRYHVLQRGWDTKGHQYVYDEWIDLKDEHYDNAGLWMRGPQDSNTDIRRQLSQALRLEAFLELMASSPPASPTSHRYLGRQYYALTYLLDPKNRLVNFPITYGSFVEGPYRARIWVDASTNLVVKGDVFGKTMRADGKPAGMSITQVFGNWNQTREIQAPRVNAR